MSASGNLINSLRHFEVVARLGSLTAAANELGVTPSAVSHHIRQLSEHTGEQLLVRSGRGVALTETGRKLAQRLTAAFAEVERSVKDVVGSDSPSIRLAICSSFGPGFLIPRLSDFYSIYPQVQLKLMLYAKPPELTDAVGDAFVTTTRHHPGYWCRLLLRENLVAVQSPARRRIRLHESQTSYITTDVEDGAIGDDWLMYWKTTRQPVPSDPSWLMCSHYMLARDMAKQGLGIALLPDFLADHDINAGTLEPLASPRLPSGRSYYLCIKQSRLKECGLEQLRAWFLGLGGRREFADCERPSDLHPPQVSL